MKIEHLTIMGNSQIRDSHDISLKTLDELKEFQIKEGTITLEFPRTNFKVKLTVANAGAMFDIMKGEHIAYTNACCFDAENKDEILGLVKSLAASTPLKIDTIRMPELDQFLYTIPINPFALTPQEAMTAGEIEFYIYYSLYLVR